MSKPLACIVSLIAFFVNLQPCGFYLGSITTYNSTYNNSFVAIFYVAFEFLTVIVFNL